MKGSRGLGKGLLELFSSAEEDYGKSLLFEESGEKSAVTAVDITKIYANPNQPRKVFDKDALEELATSIEKHGVLQPVIVNQANDGYMIIAGERRWRASKLAGLKEVPVIIKNYSERQIKEISLIENLQREDLNPVEAATAMKALMDEYGLTQDELADRLGKSRSAIANTLRLLTLASEVIKMLVSGELSAGHARTLVTLDSADQIKIARQSVKEGWSVREMEQKVKDFLTPPEEKQKKKEKRELSLELKELVDNMQRVLGTKVNAIGNDNKGRIYIDYYTRDDLDRLAEFLEILGKSNK